MGQREGRQLPHTHGSGKRGGAKQQGPLSISSDNFHPLQDASPQSGWENVE